MADIIRRLDPQVANLIAAGEVVERPASVVKELCENAIDAGATSITVEIKHGGLTYIRVTDNGKGMSRADARTAFMRHATSKISSEDDLDAITTRGFRGEALAAIGAVSKVQVLTREKGEIEGTVFATEGGEITDYGPAGCPEGTTIIVRDLFYNTPARVKFLKKDVYEAAACANEVQRQALSRPDISVSYVKDGKPVFSTEGNGELISCIYAALGREIANGLTPAKAASDTVSVTGYVTKPIASRGNRTWQYFFVNGRPIRSKMLSAALEEGYENLIMKGRHPGCVLDIKVRPSTVDVNVHPSKAEVKFASDREIYGLVYRAVLSAVSESQSPPTFSRFPVAGAKEKPENVIDNVNNMVAQNIRPTAMKGEYMGLDSRMYVKTSGDEAAGAGKSAPKKESEPAPAGNAKRTYMSFLPEREKEDAQESIEPKKISWRLVGELMTTYIVVECEGEMLIIDKHAAHEKILFEKYRSSAEKIMSQRLIFPVTAFLGGDAALIAENKKIMAEIGYDIEDFGGGSLIIRAVPEGTDADRIELILDELSQKFKRGKSSGFNSLRDELFHTMACKAAVKRGDITSRQELESLAEQVVTRPEIRYCPHGRPVVLALGRDALDRHFGRG